MTRMCSLSFLKGWLPVLLFSFFFSCDKKEDPVPKLNTTKPEFYVPTVISDQENYTATMFSSANDTVFLMLNGGPVSELDDTQYEFVFETFNQYAEPDFNVESLLQANMINPTIWQEGKKFTYEFAKAENENSIKLIEMVVKKFKEQNKKVFLIGHSFGAFLLKKLLLQGSASTLNSVEKIIIMGSRLNHDPTAIEHLKNGTPCGYDNGQFACGDPLTEDDEFVRQKLSLDIMYAQYSEKVPVQHLSKVIFVYGNTDEQGALSAEEQSFLTSNQATLLLWEEEGHSSYLFKEELVREILSKIRE